MEHFGSDRLTEPGAGSDAAALKMRAVKDGDFYVLNAHSAPTAVAPLPALAAGRITFACLNNFSKISPQALHTWIKILQALPNSRLFLHALPGSHRDRLRAALAAAGINPGTERPARCHFFGFLPFADYLALHHQIDIALDPFPYAGGTTSCDALHGRAAGDVGRPGRPVARGASILSALGLPELIAATPEAYVDIAVGLARDSAAPAKSAPLCGAHGSLAADPDARGFARDFQALLRQPGANGHTD